MADDNNAARNIDKGKAIAISSSDSDTMADNNNSARKNDKGKAIVISSSDSDNNNAARKNDKGKAIVKSSSDSDDTDPDATDTDTTDPDATDTDTDTASTHFLNFESEEEVQSKMRVSGPLYPVPDLKITLPLKRGHSSHYAGKSTSFDNLIDASIGRAVEHVLNKKRRMHIANEEYDGKKQPMDKDMDMDDGSCKNEVHSDPTDLKQDEHDEEQDDETKPRKSNSC